MSKSDTEIVAEARARKQESVSRNRDFYILYGIYEGLYVDVSGRDAMDGRGRPILRDNRRTKSESQPLVANLLKAIVDDYVSLTGTLPDIKVPPPGTTQTDQDFADYIEKFHYGVWHASNMVIQLKQMGWFNSALGGCSAVVWPNFKKRHAEIRFVSPDRVYGTPDLIDPFAYSSCIIIDRYPAQSIRDYFPDAQVQRALNEMGARNADWSRTSMVERIRWFDKDEIVTLMAAEVSDVKTRRRAASNGEEPAYEGVIEMGRAKHGLGRCLVEPFQNILLPGQVRGHCLPASEKVMTNPRGPVSISAIKPGDKVFALVPQNRTNKKQGPGGAAMKFAPRKVKAVIDHGPAPIFRIKTTSTDLRATGNHPLLAVRYVDGKRGKMAKLDWVAVDDLAVGDHVVRVDALPTQQDRRHIDPDWAWLVGFWLGDGWLRWYDTKTERRVKYRGMPRWPYPGKAVSRVEIASFDRTDADRIDRIVRRRYGTGGVVGDRVYGVNSKRFAEDLVRLGIAMPDTNAYTKHIPEAAWKWSKQAQRALLEGLIDSDGHRTKDGFSFQVTSRRLVEEFEALCLLVGYHTSRIETRPIRGIGKAESYVIRGTASPKRARTDGVGAAHKTWWSLRLPRGCRIEKVRAIVPDGNEHVYDIEVDEAHNFVAGRMVVHNSDIEQAVGLNQHINNLLSANEEYVKQEIIAPVVIEGPSKVPEDINLQNPMEIIPVELGGKVYRLNPSIAGEQAMAMNLGRAQDLVEYVTGDPKVRTQGRLQSSIATGRAIEKAQGPVFGRIEYRNDLNAFRLQRINEMTVLLTEKMFPDDEIVMFGERRRRGGVFRHTLHGKDLQGYTFSQVLYSPSMHMGLEQRAVFVAQMRGAKPRPMMDERTAIELLAYSDHPDEVIKRIDAEMERDAQYQARLQGIAQGSDPMDAMKENVALNSGAMPKPAPVESPAPEAAATIGAPMDMGALSPDNTLPAVESTFAGAPDLRAQVQRVLDSVPIKGTAYIVEAAERIRVVVVPPSPNGIDGNKVRKALKAEFGDRVMVRESKTVPDTAKVAA